VQAAQALEADDPLCGVDVVRTFQGRIRTCERWVWPVAEGQVHIMEALSVAGGTQ
jgi:hypothetical protein